MKTLSFEFEMLTDAQYKEAQEEKASELEHAREQVKYWVNEVKEIISAMKELDKIKAPEGWQYGFVEGLGYGLHPSELLKN